MYPYATMTDRRRPRSDTRREARCASRLSIVCASAVALTTGCANDSRAAMSVFDVPDSELGSTGSMETASADDEATHGDTTVAHHGDTGEGDDDNDDESKFDLPGDADVGPGNCTCSGSQDGIYVLHNATVLGIGVTEIYFFDPPAKSFTRIGALDCPAPLGWTPSSMAVDRAGHAWVSYYDLVSQSAKLFRTPLSDPEACEEVPYVPSEPGWWLIGMGYATTDPVSNCDELFVYNSDRYTESPNFLPGGSKLARYEEGSGQLELIGDTEYPVAELSGSGDGELLAFAGINEVSSVLAVLDKGTGASLEDVALPGVDIGSSFAFAMWGGDVYLFTPGDEGGRSKVTKIDRDGNEGGNVELYMADAGVLISGAGVSTCASYEPPG